MLRLSVPASVTPSAARQFTASSTQYVYADTGLGIGANDAFFFAVWARRSTTSGNQTIIGLGVAGSGNNVRRLLTDGTGGILAILADNVGSQTWATSGSTAFPAGTYVSLIGEYASTTSRRIICDGVAVSDSGNRTLGVDPDRIIVAAHPNITTYADAAIASVALFSGTASAQLITQHRQGVHPGNLPGRLIECWDLDRVGPIVGHVRGTVLQPVNGGALTSSVMRQGPSRSPRVYVDMGASSRALPVLLSRAASLGTGVR